MRRLAVGADAGALIASERSVFVLDAKGDPTRIWSTPSAEPVRIELTASGERFGVYEADRFRIYDRAGTRIADLEGPAPGLRFKLLGDGERVLTPLAEQRGEEVSPYALRIVDLGGAVLVEMRTEGLRFTHVSELQVLAALRDTVTSYGLDGTLQWTAPVTAHSLSAAGLADRVVLVDAKDTRRVIHLDRGAQIHSTELREPAWNLAAAPHGERSAVTTERRLHVFEAGALTRSLLLPVRYAVSVDIADDGRVLVGGQDEDKRGVVLCYGPDGALLARTQLEHEEQAFRPDVHFGAGMRYAALTTHGLTQGTCSEGAP
jgi:hypothetical protein